jgi:hypothetical protein
MATRFSNASGMLNGRLLYASVRNPVKIRRLA